MVLLPEEAGVAKHLILGCCVVGNLADDGLQLADVVVIVVDEKRDEGPGVRKKELTGLMNRHAMMMLASHNTSSTCVLISSLSFCLFVLLLTSHILEKVV